MQVVIAQPLPLPDPPPVRQRGTELFIQCDECGGLVMVLAWPDKPLRRVLCEQCGGKSILRN